MLIDVYEGVCLILANLMWLCLTLIVVNDMLFFVDGVHMLVVDDKCMCTDFVRLCFISMDSNLLYDSG